MGLGIVWGQGHCAAGDITGTEVGESPGWRRGSNKVGDRDGAGGTVRDGDGVAAGLGTAQGWGLELGVQ